MASRNLTPFQKELADIAKKVKEFRNTSEGSVIGVIYKNPNVLFDTNLDAKDFMNEIYKIYFTIAQELIIKEKKKSLDIMTVGLYLEQHPKLQSIEPFLLDQLVE